MTDSLLETVHAPDASISSAARLSRRTRRFKATPLWASAMLLTACAESTTVGDGGIDAGPRADARAADASTAHPDTLPADATDPTCTTLRVTAHSTLRPIDVIIWVDDGGSFAGGRSRVSAAINGSLAAILEASGADYKVIMLSSATTVAAPLGTSPTRFFRVPGGFSAGGGGYVFFSDASYLPHYLSALRPDAFKVFLSNTDCEHEAGTFASFESALMTNGGGAFTVGPDRNFVYHMIGNVALRTPSTDAWLPADPIAGRGAYSSFTNCTNTQTGARTTGGFRLGVNAMDYDTLFRAIANASITQARLPCTFEPPTDHGVDLDLSRVRFRYTPGDGSPEQVYRQVPSMAMCSSSGGFYVDSAGLIQLCPTTCTTVRGDATGEVLFSFECTPG